MRVLCSLMFYFSMLLGQAHAQSIHGEMTFPENVSTFKEGDLVEATLRFWPIENADLAQFRKLEKALVFNSFYLAQITDLGVSTNNADVVELKGVFIVKSAQIQPVFGFKYNDTVIEIKNTNLHVQETKDQSKDFYVLDQSLNARRVGVFILGICLALLIVAFMGRKSLKNLASRFRPDEAKKLKKRYDEFFRKADRREDFELIYREKNQWLPLLVEKTPGHMDFLKIVNQHQFKKEWGNEEYADIRASFDVIRRSFEK